MHAVGARRPFAERLTLDVATFGRRSRDWLLAHDIVPPDAARVWRELVDAAPGCLPQPPSRPAPSRQLRLHGDCHPGNILWTRRTGPHFVDLDDAVTGPAVQDLWMLLSGDRARR